METFFFLENIWVKQTYCSSHRSFCCSKRVQMALRQPAALAPIFQAGEGVLTYELLPLIVGEDLFFLENSCVK